MVNAAGLRCEPSCRSEYTTLTITVNNYNNCTLYGESSARVNDKTTDKNDRIVTPLIDRHNINLTKRKIHETGTEIIPHESEIKKCRSNTEDLVEEIFMNRNVAPDFKSDIPHKEMKRKDQESADTTLDATKNKECPPHTEKCDESCTSILTERNWSVKKTKVSTTQAYKILDLQHHCQL